MKRFLLLAIVVLSVGQMSMAWDEQAVVDQLSEEIGDFESIRSLKSCVESCDKSCLEEFIFESGDKEQAAALIVQKKCVLQCAVDAFDKKGLPYHPFLQEALEQQSESTEQPVVAE